MTPPDDDTPDSEFDLSRQLDDADREIRIDKMREEIENKGGTFGTPKDAPPLDPKLEESFLANIIAFENAPETTHARMLLDDGITLPSPDELTEDKELHEKLWEVIHGLAKRNVFLSSTNHLNDRELYTHLWSQSLNEITEDLSGVPGYACHLDILGGCSDEDTRLQLKYYADEDARRRWVAEFPDYELPEPCTPPHDRDKDLPQRDS